MTTPRIAARDLVTMLIRHAGTDESSEGLLAGDPADLLGIPLPDLGFDSLAVLNTLGKLTTEFGIKLDDDTFTDPKMTLGVMLAKINEALRK